MSPEPIPQPRPEPLENHEWLARAIASYSTYLMFVAGKLKGQHQAAEGASDLVQKCLVTALDRIRAGKVDLPGQSEEEVRIWLRRLLRDTWSDTKKRLQAQKRTPTERPLPTPLSPSGEAILNETALGLIAARASLAPEERQLIEWHDDEELTFEEIGRRKGYSTSFASRKYREAREKLDRAYPLGRDRDAD